jgi:hypothetical protein
MVRDNALQELRVFYIHEIHLYIVHHTENKTRNAGVKILYQMESKRPSLPMNQRPK